MKILLFALVAAIGYSGIHAQTEFKQNQQTYPRVRNAYHEIEDSLLAALSLYNLHLGEIEIYLQAFKREKVIEIWARNQGEGSYNIIKSYNFCRTSGVLGPKRMEGDLQIPEGFYQISAFNPWSSYHLSICINYPNQSDRMLGVQGNLGGNICIHGSCTTIGCIPLTDEVIKEVYLLCVEARNNGQTRIPVTIYPAKLNHRNFNILIEEYRDDGDKVNLWSDLKIAYDLFELNRLSPEITFLRNGRHLINQQNGKYEMGN